MYRNGMSKGNNQCERRQKEVSPQWIRKNKNRLQARAVVLPISKVSRTAGLRLKPVKQVEKVDKIPGVAAQATQVLVVLNHNILAVHVPQVATVSTLKRTIFID